MMFCRLVLILLVGYVCADMEYVRKKLCKDVDSSQCAVNSVIADCAHGSTFCAMKKNKKYLLTLNLTPRFSAHKLKLGMYGDIYNDESYQTVIKSPEDGCSVLTCPLQTNETRIFDVDLMLDKRFSGKFPIKVKLWNEEDETKTCCFTFTVKVK